MKSQPVFGMAFRFNNPIKRTEAAALLRMVRRRTRPLVLAPHSYFVDGFILHTR